MRKIRDDDERILFDALEDMVNQHCTPMVRKKTANYDLDSFALSANAFAMRLLAEFGRIKIHDDFGRRVIASWVSFIKK